MPNFDDQLLNLVASFVIGAIASFAASAYFFWRSQKNSEEKHLETLDVIKQQIRIVGVGLKEHHDGNPVGYVFDEETGLLKANVIHRSAGNGSSDNQPILTRIPT